MQTRHASMIEISQDELYTLSVYALSKLTEKTSTQVAKEMYVSAVKNIWQHLAEETKWFIKHEIKARFGRGKKAGILNEILVLESETDEVFYSINGGEMTPIQRDKSLSIHALTTSIGEANEINEEKAATLQIFSDENKQNLIFDGWLHVSRQNIYTATER